MLLCGPLWVFCGSFVVLCGPLRYLVIPMHSEYNRAMTRLGITQHVTSTTTAWVLRRTGGFKGGGKRAMPPQMPSTAKSRQLLGDIVPQTLYRGSAPGPPELAPPSSFSGSAPATTGKLSTQPAYVS